MVSAGAEGWRRPDRQRGSGPRPAQLRRRSSGWVAKGSPENGNGFTGGTEEAGRFVRIGRKSIFDPEISPRFRRVEWNGLNLGYVVSGDCCFLSGRLEPDGRSAVDDA